MGINLFLKLYATVSSSVYTMPKSTRISPAWATACLGLQSESRAEIQWSGTDKFVLFSIIYNVNLQARLLRLLHASLVYISQYKTTKSVISAILLHNACAHYDQGHDVEFVCSIALYILPKTVMLLSNTATVQWHIISNNAKV